MNDMRQMTQRGRAIEEGSFAIVDREAGEHDFPEGDWAVVRRVIHATADFEFKDTMRFHSGAVASGIEALRSGCNLVLDVRMIEVGLSKPRLGAYGCKTHCFISDEDVITRAKKKNTTRAIEAMVKARDEGVLDGAIIAVGNAPTALLELKRLIEAGKARPALIVGVPVGFVSAEESKAALLDLDVPYIVALGRKGGSPIAVAIIHALLKQSEDLRRTQDGAAG